MARRVRERAGSRCEYCRLPEFAVVLPFQIDHIIAVQHGGQAADGNLAFACPYCNRYKGPNIAGIDMDSGSVARLFHPRTDVWTEHFEFNGVWVKGKTAIGRATVDVLRMNAPDRLLLRAELLKERGLF